MDLHVFPILNPSPTSLPMTSKHITFILSEHLLSTRLLAKPVLTYIVSYDPLRRYSSSLHRTDEETEVERI